MRLTESVKVDQINNIDLYEIAGETVAVIDARMKIKATPELDMLVQAMYKLTKAEDTIPRCFPQDGKLDGYRREKHLLFQDENCKWIWQLSDTSFSGNSPLCTDDVLQDIDAMYREERPVIAGKRGDFNYEQKPKSDLSISEPPIPEKNTKRNRRKQTYSRIPSDDLLE